MKDLIRLARIPYRIDKNLGKAYNEEFERAKDEDWVMLCDHDTCLLTPDTIANINHYAHILPDAGLLTCFTNRIHPLATDQLIDGSPSENFDMKYWIGRARNQRSKLFEYTEIKREVSGFVMVISKRTWMKHKFIEQPSPLGVDNYFCWKILADGLKIYRMDGIIVWHTYRDQNIHDKSHLK